MSATLTSSRAFADSVILVTGGTSGIGLAIAEAFLDAGASVAVCARAQPGLDAFTARHPGTLAIRADVTDPRDRTAMLDTVEARFGRVDILVNNAGVLIERDFTRADDVCEGLDDEVALNLTAPIALAGAVLARWPTPRALVFVTSGYALVSPTRAPTYGAVKAGLHGYVEGLRRQLAGRATQVLEVLPPAVDTPATRHSSAAKIPPRHVADATLKALVARRPLALVGQTRLLPLMLRLAPRMIGRIVAAT